VVELWLGQPAAMVVHPSERHLGLLRGLLGSVGTAANLVNDAQLAALALEHGAEVVSFDRDVGRFEGVRATVPAAAG
jgi:predicted nucleic acid-binding protein